MKNWYLPVLMICALAAANVWSQEKKEEPAAPAGEGEKNMRDPFGPIRLNAGQGAPDVKSANRSATLADVARLRGVVMAGDRSLAIVEINSDNVLFLRPGQTLRLAYESNPGVQEFTLTKVGIDFALFEDDSKTSHYIRIR